MSTVDLKMHRMELLSNAVQESELTCSITGEPNAD